MNSYPHILICWIIPFFFTACESCIVEQREKESGFLNFEEIGIHQIQEGYASKEYTIEELTLAFLKRIHEIDDAGPELNAITTINPNALTEAAALQKEYENGNFRGPLHGIPVVLKDNIDTKDMPTTCGSRALAASYPLNDSPIVHKLKDAGAVILGKANLSEWANFRGEMSSSGWSGVGGQTKNPYVLSRNPCGSSSGSGVAVSASLAVIAVGTETNGSIVCPSHANGIVGIKPTVGLLSRSGIIPISYTQDTPGPMARTVTDAAIALGVMTGIDSTDAKTIASEGKFLKDYTPYLNKGGLKGKKIGLYTEPLGRNFKVDTLVNRAVQVFKKYGAEVIELESISTSNVGALSFDIMLFEYKDGLNKYFKSLGDEAPIGSIEDLIAFNKTDSVELKYYNQKYLEMASAKGDLDSPEYLMALEKMALATQKNGIDRVMDEHGLDAIIAPTGSPAWKTDWVNGDSFHLGSSSPAARAGYPNITVPMGFVEELPVGLSIFGKAWSEPQLIEIAYAFEQATLHRRAPKFLN